jgi:4,5-DOPA dioxygenase extradiol
MDRAPSIFISHGAPSVLTETGPWQLALEMIGRDISPRAVVVMSAHWRSRAGFDVGFQSQFETIHDFSGFSDALQRFKYPAKGHQDLAQQCVDLLNGAAFSSSLEPSRGLDHGSYVPLHFMWPKADVPVVPVAISAKATPQDVFRVGEILAPLRQDGVLVLGSGGMVHNLGAIEWQRPSDSLPETWASEFEDWVIKALSDRDFSALCDFRDVAPHGKEAHPTWEHFAPLVFAAGAASAWGEELQELYRGWAFGNLSMSCVGFGVNHLN